MVRATLVIGILAVGVVVSLCVTWWPLIRAERERQRVAAEVRHADLHTRHVVHGALQAMLDEARRSS